MSTIIPTNKETLSELINQVQHCKLCASDLPLGPRPIIQIHQNAQLLIIGQAPGLKVHESGVPWNDASGERLRNWMGIGEDLFYDAQQIAILPMGFCYPGRGKTGDRPPRKICAPQWHDALIHHLPQLKMTLLVGQYAQQYYLAKAVPPRPKTLTQTVRQWQDWAPKFIPLPHPSPRNNIWLRKNPWFEEELIPSLRQYVRDIFKID